MRGFAVLFVAATIGCAGGGGDVAASSGAHHDAGGAGAGGSDVDSGTGAGDGSADVTGGADGTPDAPAESDPWPQGTCSDQQKNQSESDIDCGGTCPPCADGKACGSDPDCAGGSCISGVCCAPKTYSKTTGQSSGNVTVCCDGNDVRTSFTDCAVGNAHGVNAGDPNCASAYEGANNGGTACAQVECRSTTACQ